MGRVAVARLLSRLHRSWEKNWPEAYCALRKGMPSFVFSAHPAPVTDAVPVFCFHRVQAGVFERDLSFLQRSGYQTIGADDLFSMAFRLLRQFGMKAVAFIASRFHLEEEKSERGHPCTWREIAQMHETGRIDFQSHTYEHRYIPRWPETVPHAGYAPEYTHALRSAGMSLADDLERSKRVIEEKLGRRGRHLAFPMYKGTPEAIRLGRLA